MTISTSPGTTFSWLPFGMSRRVPATDHRDDRQPEPDGEDEGALLELAPAGRRGSASPRGRRRTTRRRSRTRFSVAIDSAELLAIDRHHAERIEDAPRRPGASTDSAWRRSGPRPAGGRAAPGCRGGSGGSARRRTGRRPATCSSPVTVTRTPSIRSSVRARAFAKPHARRGLPVTPVERRRRRRPCRRACPEEVRRQRDAQRARLRIGHHAPGCRGSRVHHSRAALAASTGRRNPRFHDARDAPAADGPARFEPTGARRAIVQRMSR